MRTVSITIGGRIVTVVFPTRDDVLNLKVGDLAPDYGGMDRPVVSIYGQGIDIKGFAYVCYYTGTGTNNGSTVSNCVTERKVLRTVSLSCWLTSAQLDAAERELSAVYPA